MLKYKTLDEALQVDSSHVHIVSPTLCVVFESEDKLPDFLIDGISDEARTPEQNKAKQAWIDFVSS